VTSTDPAAETPGGVRADAPDLPGPGDHVPAATAAAHAASLRTRVAAATARLQDSAARLDDSRAREASLLPGWSRGHLLSHLARNADSLRNLLIWARTGVVTPQYRDAAEREEGIQEGAGRPAADLLADLESSAAALDAEAASLPDAAWSAEVRGGPLAVDDADLDLPAGSRRAAHPAWFTLWRRLSEVEIHHVDLGAGYSPADWPSDFAAYCLQGAAGGFTGPDAPVAVLSCSDVPLTVQIGKPGAEPAVTISGPVRSLLAWLIGRGDGSDLTSDPAGPLPAVPPW
jgi:maleylpyruvate isomerase